MSHFDVIIIGGRCAGATLAVHLAQHDLKVLVVDRATFPSLPSVPSSPIIHPGTMRLLDELGIPEKSYTLPGGKIEHYILDFLGHFNAVVPTARMQLDRSYNYGIDRRKFDNAIWTHLQQNYPQVVTRDNFAVTDILKNSAGDVTGIVGKTPGRDPEEFTADLVVGADGRFSFAARKFGAEIVEESSDYPTAGYQAEWENVEEYADELPSSVCMYNTMQGMMVLFVPQAQRRYIVCAYMPSQNAKQNGAAPQEYYQALLESVPQVWNRLAHARQVGEVEAMRQIENGYREAFGNGWALVGDALHYKDPLDGQGIYDALVESKILGEVIARWKTGELSWQQAGAEYNRRVLEATHAMFLSTAARVKREVYSIPPKFIVNTLIRWLLTDPNYQAAFLRYIARAIDPSEVPSMPTAGMIWRGLKRDVRNWLTPKKQRQSPSTIPMGS